MLLDCEVLTKLNHVSGTFIVLAPPTHAVNGKQHVLNKHPFLHPFMQIFLEGFLEAGNTKT